MHSRIAMVVGAGLAFVGCTDRDHLPFKSMTVRMIVTKLGDGGGGVSETSSVVSDGPLVTADPDLACKVKQDTEPGGSVSIECSRAANTMTASFSCPDSGTKVGSTAGSWVVGSSKLRLSHSFSVECAYAAK